MFEGAEQNPDLRTLLPGNIQANATGPMQAKVAALNEALAGLQKMQVSGGEVGADGKSAVAADAQATPIGVAAQMAMPREMADLQAIHGQLSQSGLQAQMQLMQGQGIPEGGVPLSGLMLDRGAVKGRALNGNSQNLSGGEFLNTLGLVKGGPLGLNQAQMEKRMEMETGDDSGGLDSSPDLKMIMGGQLEKSKLIDQRHFSEDLMSSSPQSLTGQSLNGASSQGLSPAAQAPVIVTGNVTSGPMATERLSSESLMGIGTGIRNLSSQGGGEMHVRLKPENLGELHLRVVTQGNNVGLHIQAPDDRARKIIEESLGHLKAQLSTQNLSLSKVDVTVAQSLGSASGNLRNDQGQQQGGQQALQHLRDMMADSRQQQGNRQNAWNGTEAGARTGAIARALPTSSVSMTSGDSRSSGRASDGRLDVRA